MRQGEMLSLTWSDVDLDKRIAHLDMTRTVRAETCRSAAARSVRSYRFASSKLTSASCPPPKAP
jgi:integrase